MAGGYAGSIVRFRSDPAQLHLRWRFLGYRNSEPGFPASISGDIGRPAAVADRHRDRDPHGHLYAGVKDAQAYAGETDANA